MTGDSPGLGEVPNLGGGAACVLLSAGVFALDVTVLVVRLVSRVARPLVAAALDSIDVNDVVANVDLDAIVARLDLDELARRMITAVDLAQIVRESSSTLTSEAVHGVRAECARADDAIARLVDRVLRRTPADRPPLP